MPRGEFRFQNGLVIPNNVMKFGLETVLLTCFRDAAVTFYVGLAAGVYEHELQIEDLDEPTIGINGYARQALARNSTDWPTLGELNGEPFIESKELTWEADGGPFDESITRMFITTTLAGATGDVFALSAALPELLEITPDTDLADRTFTYRFYMR